MKNSLGMGKYYGTVEYVSYSLTWIGINVLPNFLYVSSLIYYNLMYYHDPSYIYSWSIEPLSLLHSKLKFEWVTLESMIWRSVTRLNLVTCIYLFLETDYNQPLKIN